jgi:hypothetical protein
MRTVLMATIVVGIGITGMSGAAQSPRFVDNMDGTISDEQTGLMWEKKTACQGATANDIHCVNNEYEWTKSGNDPDGSLFTDFLQKLNRGEGQKKYSDWRIPSIDELKTIVDCTKTNCLDPVFGPTQASRYWSSTAYLDSPGFAWTVNFFNAQMNFRNSTNPLFARAVRGPR